MHIFLVLNIRSFVFLNKNSKTTQSPRQAPTAQLFQKAHPSHIVHILLLHVRQSSADLTRQNMYMIAAKTSIKLQCF